MVCPVSNYQVRNLTDMKNPQTILVAAKAIFEYGEKSFL
jgi:hypothetical protein